MGSASGWRRWGGLEGLLRLFVLVALCVVFYLIEPRFAGTSNFINMGRQASILALAAFGQAIVIIAGGIDISVGSVIGLVSVAAALAAKAGGLWAGLTVGLLAGLGAGLTSGAAVAYLGVQPVIATVGMLTFARALGFYITRAQPVTGLPVGAGFLGNGKLGPVPVPILVAVAVLLLGQFFLGHLRLGRDLYAIGSDEEAARNAGIPVARRKWLAYGLSGVGAALAALILTSRFISGQPTTGTAMELQSIAAVVIGGTPMGGGVGSLWRTVIGVLTMAVLANGMDLAGISPYMQQVALGAIIVIAIAFDAWQRRGPLGRLLQLDL